jgi:hypothetical protein
MSRLLYEYAATAQCMIPNTNSDEEERLRSSENLLTLIRRVVEHGIFSIPERQQWTTSIYTHLIEHDYGRTSSNVEKAMSLLIENDLISSRPAEVRLDGNELQEEDWVELISQTNRTRAYDYRLHSSQNSRAQGFHTVSELLQNDAWNELENEVSVPGNREGVGRQLGLFLSTQGKLYINDPHLINNVRFAPHQQSLSRNHKRWFASLKEIDRLIYENRAPDNKLYSLEIHSYQFTDCDNKPEEETIKPDELTKPNHKEENLLDFIAKYMPNCKEQIESGKMTFHLWRCHPRDTEKNHCKKGHNRFICSPFRGLRFENGIDFAQEERDTASDVDISLFGKKRSEREIRHVSKEYGYRKHLGTWRLN